MIVLLIILLPLYSHSSVSWQLLSQRYATSTTTAAAAANAATAVAAAIATAGVDQSGAADHTIQHTASEALQSQ
jgi:hypothetical protein